MVLTRMAHRKRRFKNPWYNFFMKQKALFKISDYGSEFGGSFLKPGQRKTQRPLSSKNALKIVLRADMQKSRELARSAEKKLSGIEVVSPHAEIRSLLKYRKQIDELFVRFAAAFHVKIYEKALVSNHIHFVARFDSRDQYKKFMRALTGTIAKQLKIKWHLRPWSRIVAWGRGLKSAIQYTVQNHLEAIGTIPYQPRLEDRRRTRWLLRQTAQRQTTQLRKQPSWDKPGNWRKELRNLNRETKPAAEAL